MPILTTLGAACARAWGFTSGLLKDPYFNLTTLLLPGNGTNGAQNNTFLDSSTNNFTITRNGNTTQGTFSPFSQTGWGAYFDGSNDSLTIPSGSSISGTGNFTVECWMYPLTFASGYRVFYANETSGGLSLLINSTGTLSYGRALVAVDGTTTGTVNFNQWNHVAFVRSGTGSNQFICYINGQSAGSFTNSTSYSSGIVRIGTDGGGINYPFPGYLSNIRSVIIAVYTGNFTPPIAPLTATQSAGTNISAITGTQTSLLTCQSNRFVDNGTANSGSGFIVTAYNGTAITPFSPFAPTAAYTTAAVGGSGYFDGTGDFLSATNASALQLTSSTAFTIEFWWYPTSLAAQQYVQSAWVVGSTGYAIATGVSSFTVSELAFFDGTTWRKIGNPVLNAWNHIAIVSSGTSNTGYLYLNGSPSAAFTVASTINYTSGTWYLGQNSSSGAYANGYVTDFRLLKGTNLYPSGTAFTPPTAPLTAITNTSLLLNYTNAGITDATAKNDLETVGNAQISTSVSKFGGGSIAFDGSGDWLIAPPTQNLALGSGDFTIETWIYPIAYSGSSIYPILIANGSADAAAAGEFSFYINHPVGSTIIYFNTSGTGQSLSGGSIVATGGWSHVAISRSSGTLRVFINGAQQYSGACTASFGLATNQTTIGVRTGNTAQTSFNGYMDDLRITRGLARYTANFTPPTAPFPVQ